MEIYPSL